MITLEANKVEFFSDADESNFFNWLNSLSSVLSVEGAGESIFIIINSVDEGNLREIISLFTRYKIDMKQLATLKTAQNSSWFYKKNMYWYKQIWG